MGIRSLNSVFIRLDQGCQLTSFVKEKPDKLCQLTSLVLSTLTTDKPCQELTSLVNRVVQLPAAAKNYRQFLAASGSPTFKKLRDRSRLDR